MESWLRGRKKKSVRIVFKPFVCSKNANQFVYFIIVGLHIFITDRPVVAETINASSFEIFRTKPQGDSSPVIRSATKHPGPPPIPLGTFGFSKAFSVQIPAA